MGKLANIADRSGDIAAKAGKVFSILGALKAATTLHEDVPLAYNLMLDPRTPTVSKAWFAAKVTGAAVAMPLDIEIPILGGVDLLFFVKTFRSFVDSVERRDPTLVAEHRAALAAGTSTFDKHVAKGVDTSKAFGEALVSSHGPVRGGVRRVGVAGRDVAKTVGDVTAPVVRKVGDTGKDAARTVGDAGRKVTSPIRDVARKVIHRGRGLDA